MDIVQIRMAVSGAYSSRGWDYKVSNMSDAQVYATYIRLKGVGKIK